MKLPSNAAVLAEAAVDERHIKPLWNLPGARIGAVNWPPSDDQFQWHYWWQAHLLDCMIDAQLRAPSNSRLAQIKRQMWSHFTRNGFRWTNDYYDDMAWLALAIFRAKNNFGIKDFGAVHILSSDLMRSWKQDKHGGRIPWGKGENSNFFNAPANGPAGILFARLGDASKVRRALHIGEWIDRTLIDYGNTELVFDGIRSPGKLETAMYTYCQGVVIGLELELFKKTKDEIHLERAYSLVDAVYMHMLSADGVIRGKQNEGGGDGGLFKGILVRYLTQASLVLSKSSESQHAKSAGQRARDMVIASAESAWKNRQTVDGLPLFGPDWTKPAVVPDASSKIPERDLSVQLSGWMLMEAAHVLSGFDKK